MQSKVVDRPHTAKELQKTVKPVCIRAFNNLCTTGDLLGPILSVVATEQSLDSPQKH